MIREKASEFAKKLYYMHWSDTEEIQIPKTQNKATISYHTWYKFPSKYGCLDKKPQ